MTLANLILALRALASDTADSKPIFGEELTADPTTPANGTNAYFRLRNVPVAGATVWVSTVGGAFRATTGFTFDATTGIITYSPTVPVTNAQLRADYYYYWFSDAKHQVFLEQGARGLLQGGTDPTLVVDGLTPALLQYALAAFFRARASQYQDKYDSSGGDNSQQVSSVAKGFAALAKDAQANGDKLRDDYYANQGANQKAAFSNPATYPAPRIDPITPRA